MAKIDILLPYWGDVELLKVAVESVFDQTEKDWRLLVFDDHYPSDEPAQYFSTLNDPRVVYHRNAENLGITNNFNYSLSHATADYCVMMGCDDRMLPNYLEVALAHLENVDFYQPNVEVIDAKGDVYLPLGDKVKDLLRPKTPGVYSGEKLASSLCNGNWLYFPSIVWRTTTIKKYGFNPKFKVVQDLALVLNIVVDGGRLYVDNIPTFQYRRFAKSLSSIEKLKGGVRFKEESGFYKHYAEEFKKIGWNKASLSAKMRITSRLHQYLSK